MQSMVSYDCELDIMLFGNKHDIYACIA